MTEAIPPSPFGAASLSAAVAQTLAMEVPAQHGFATIVNMHGITVALATRTGDGWEITLEAGYDWDGVARGPRGELRIGKSW